MVQHAHQVLELLRAVLAIGLDVPTAGPDPACAADSLLLGQPGGRAGARRGCRRRRPKTLQTLTLRTCAAQPGWRTTWPAPSCAAA